MTGYIPPTDQQLPPGSSLPRTSSSASTKYTPGPYTPGGPSPQMSDPIPIPPHVRGGAPAIAGQPIGATPPIANSGYGTSPGYFGTSPHASPAAQGYLGTPQAVQGYVGTPQAVPYPPSQPHPGYPTVPPVQGALHPADAVDPRMRPSTDRRRASASSTHSHHSHHSTRSGHTDHSHHSRRDSHGGQRRHSASGYESDSKSYDERHDRDRRRSEGGSVKSAKKTVDRRPTLGDTVYSFFGVIKEALGPRDKY